jgi:hypothetical protein
MQIYKLLTEFIGLNKIDVRTLPDNRYGKITSPKEYMSWATYSKLKKVDCYYYLNDYSTYKHKEEFLTKFRGFFIDFDLDWNLERIKNEFDPTVIVFSGRGYHLYYIFESPYIDKKEISRMVTIIKKWNKFLHNKYNIDTKNPASAFPRLPRSINTKNGKTVSVVYVGHKYTEEQFLQLIKYDSIKSIELTSNNIEISGKLTKEIIEYVKQNTEYTNLDWVVSLTKIKKLQHMNGTPDISKIYFVAIKSAVERGMSDLDIIAMCYHNPILRKQMAKRGGLNKYTIEEIYRILDLVGKPENKPELKTEFEDTTLQSFYDAKADISSYYEYLSKQSKMTLVKTDNVVIGEYNDVKNNELEAILSKADIDKLALIGFNIDEYMMYKTKYIKPVKPKLDFSAIYDKIYKENEFILQKYKKELQVIFNKPLKDIVKYIKPAFYRIPPNILKKLIHEKSNRIFILKEVM